MKKIVPCRKFLPITESHLIRSLLVLKGVGIVVVLQDRTLACHLIIG